MKKNLFLLFLLGALACKNSKTNLSIDLGGNGGKVRVEMLLLGKMELMV
jgi:hypothetical protein